MDTALHALPFVLIGVILILFLWKHYKGGFFSGSPRKAELNLLVGIVGASIGCGLFLGFAIMAFEQGFLTVESRLFNFGLRLLMAIVALYVAITCCKKVLKLIP